MRISISIFFAIAVYGCTDNYESEIQVNNDDKIEREKISFLERPIINDIKIQDSLFDQFSGLWEFIFWENYENQKSSNKKYNDVLFRNGMSWPLDYPCSWEYKPNAEQVYLTTDSIFFTQVNANYIDEASYKFRNDSLIISRGDYLEYYVRKDYDTTILNQLEKLEFNKDCILGKWKLTEISDSIMNGFQINDSWFGHVPRSIDMSQYSFSGNILVNNNDTSQYFLMEQFIRLFDHAGDRKHFLLQEIRPENGNYNYLYQPEQ